jgi:hypothetical protein
MNLKGGRFPSCPLPPANFLLSGRSAKPKFRKLEC